MDFDFINKPQLQAPKSGYYREYNNYYFVHSCSAEHGFAQTATNFCLLFCSYSATRQILLGKEICQN